MLFLCVFVNWGWRWKLKQKIVFANVLNYNHMYINGKSKFASEYCVVNVWKISHISEA